MKYFLSILLLLGFTTLQACSCIQPPSVQESFDNTPLLIHGEVVNLEYVSEGAMNAAGNGNKEISKMNALLSTKLYTKVDIKIEYQYKGNVLEDIVTIYTSRIGSACGYTFFEVGKSFIIYASVRAGVYYTHRCTRTSPAKKYMLEELDAICE